MSLEEGEKGKRELPMKKVTVKKAAAAAGFAAVLFGIYFGAAAYFHSHFLPSTVLNGILASGRSCEAVEQLITEEINSYELILHERDGKEETLKGADISLKPEFGTEISELLSQQNAFSWPAALFFAQELEEDTIVSFDESKLKKAVEKLDCMQKQNQKPPKDAYCSEYSKDGYQIIAEEQGSKIDKKQLIAVLKEAVRGLEEGISLDEKECYVRPKVTSDDKKLVKLVDTLNRYAGVVITYDTGGKQEVLDGGTIHEWLDVKDMRVSIDEEAVEEYVGGLASSYNTAFRKHTLKTSYGTTVEITDGDYGWKLDKEGEKEQILEDVKAGKSKKREFVYSQRASSHGENDYGDTYVEINLTAQHLFFYKDGVLVTESDFVSGNISKKFDTPTGIYALTYKERDAVLRGENYASPVSYWMPFCNNVGMHDASWRSGFGGSIYKTSGSHGCINLPSWAARQIFEQIEKGDPVLVYKTASEKDTPPEKDLAGVALQ